MSNLDYLDWIFVNSRKKNKRRSEQTLEAIATGFFQSAKDYTECIGVLEALSKYLIDVGIFKEIISEQAHIYVIGDGKDPQTGHLLAKKFHKSKVISVDPRLRSCYKDRHKLLPNQSVYCGKVESFLEILEEPKGKHSIIVGVHNHGPIEELYHRLCNFGQRVIVVSLPCCTMDANLSTKPTRVYDDTAILSKKNRIYIWDSNEEN